MKKFLCFSLCFLLIIQISLFKIHLVYAKSNQRAAKIINFSGNVKISKAGGEKSFNAVEGMSLMEGDSISTDSNSWIKLYIDDDKEVKIGSSSVVNLSQLSGNVKDGNDKTRINLSAGKIWSNIKRKLKVNAKYEIKVPTITMGVRGTQFSVESNENGEVTVAVLEGSVAATKSSSNENSFQVLITKNKETTIEPKDNSINDVIIKDINPNNLSLFLLEIINDKAKSQPNSFDEKVRNNISSNLVEKSISYNNKIAHQESTLVNPIIIIDPSIKNYYSKLLTKIADNNTKITNPRDSIETTVNKINSDVQSNPSIPSGAKEVVQYVTDNVNNTQSTKAQPTKDDNKTVLDIFNPIQNAKDNAKELIDKINSSISPSNNNSSNNQSGINLPIPIPIIKH